MRMLRPVVFALGALLVPLATSSAQLCLGGNTFDNGKLVVGGQGNFQDGANRFAAVGAYGMPKSWWVGATVGSTSPKVGDSVIDFGGSLGYQFPVSDNPLEICPYATLGYSSVSGFHTTSYSFGGAIGWHAQASDDLMVHPAAGLAWLGESFTGDGYSGSTSAHTWVMSANVGLIINKQWAIVPGISKTTEDGSKAVFNIAVTYSIK
jgi:hypothetical protein